MCPFETRHETNLVSMDNNGKFTTFLSFSGINLLAFAFVGYVPYEKKNNFEICFNSADFKEIIPSVSQIAALLVNNFNTMTTSHTICASLKFRYFMNVLNIRDSF